MTFIISLFLSQVSSHVLAETSGSESHKAMIMVLARTVVSSVDLAGGGYIFKPILHIFGRIYFPIGC